MSNVPANTLPTATAALSSFLLRILGMMLLLMSNRTLVDSACKSMPRKSYVSLVSRAWLGHLPPNV